ncbi:hypothetical protein OIU83_10555 [Flavobacterium sp. LS1R49]|uniref:Uncharacterized protein n=1 Tax=Flavobacterium shii TaxID=2987687 RepID=A0A9X2ZBB9_9FLAO|nr:hypothetical protein [Flavobacterium shii]
MPLRLLLSAGTNVVQIYDKKRLKNSKNENEQKEKTAVNITFTAV